MVVVYVTLWGTTKLVFSAAGLFTFPCEHMQVLISPSHHIIYFYFLDYNSPSGCEVMLHCGFDSYSPSDQRWWACFPCACWPFMYLLGRNVCSSFLPIFKLLCLFSDEMQAFLIVWVLYPCQTCLVSNFSNAVDCLDNVFVLSWYFILSW